MFDDKRFINNWISDVYDDSGSGDNVQYSLSQQEFRLEKLRAKFLISLKLQTKNHHWPKLHPGLMIIK